MPASKYQPFWSTGEHRRFVEFCEACRIDRTIGLCYGTPGVGKTVSTNRYAHWRRIESLFTHPFDPVHGLPITLSALRTMVYTPGIITTPKRARDEILHLRAQLTALRFDLLRATPPKGEVLDAIKRMEKHDLLIIDEADRLTMPSIEQIRDLYDRYDLPVILIGMPGLEKRLMRYPQLYSRVGFVHHFQTLSDKEIQPIVDQLWLKISHHPYNPNQPEDRTASIAIVRMTRGNLRLLDRLFKQMRRVMKINHLAQIDERVVEAARESLVVGVV